MIASLFLFLFFQVAQPTPTPTAPEPRKTPSATTTTAQEKEQEPAIRKHSIRIGNQTLNYTTTAGFIPIRNPQTGEVEARMFFMAYTLDGVQDVSKRPLTFSFNGGPGSSSVWLHLGALGPKRVKMLDDGFMPPPPYELVDNEYTWLTETDLVFVDTVGTGYSRATKPELASKFFSVNGDIESVGEFIRMYLVQYQRWKSPIFLVGESYGTTRVSGLTNHLFERGIALNGILLISPVLNFQTIRFADGNDLPLILILPSYTATAWYHKKLPPALQSKPLQQVLEEARNFAINEYAPALLKIDRLSQAEKQNLLEKMSNFTGLKPQFIEQNNFRVELAEFNKELLREQRKMTGRLDSRFTGFDKDASGNAPSFDPSLTAIRPPYTATFNDYIRRELDFKSDLEYYILGGGIGTWNWNVTNNYADVAPALKLAMSKNPYMKIFVACGYYDMATPFFAAEYTISAMNLEPELKRNVSFAYYEAGHMMYIEKESLQKLKDDITKFYRNAVRR
ncbi:MAG: peptidase S10 [Acidobacteria bacterium]|jgi:carboxypeptidase C (cathepsin A)|nr:MAG: peptidase S10 [Acidobacteriota bacterium]GIU83051.1 MAG: peptidase S10 [Pyrinomonadaceae bacterium]